MQKKSQFYTPEQFQLSFNEALQQFVNEWGVDIEASADYKGHVTIMVTRHIDYDVPKSENSCEFTEFEIDNYWYAE